MILATIGYGLWSVRRRHHYSWNLHLHSQIQLLARRSIRSSARSEKRIATISQIAYDLLQSDSLADEQFDVSTREGSQSTAMSHYTYL